MKKIILVVVCLLRLMPIAQAERTTGPKEGLSPEEIEHADRNKRAERALDAVGIIERTLGIKMTTKRVGGFVQASFDEVENAATFKNGTALKVPQIYAYSYLVGELLNKFRQEKISKKQAQAIMVQWLKPQSQIEGTLESVKYNGWAKIRISDKEQINLDYENGIIAISTSGLKLEKDKNNEISTSGLKLKKDKNNEINMDVTFRVRIHEENALIRQEWNFAKISVVR